MPFITLIIVKLQLDSAAGKSKMFIPLPLAGKYHKIPTVLFRFLYGIFHQYFHITFSPAVGMHRYCSDTVCF